MPFECDECQYRSGTAASIVQHKRICHHIGERVECYKGCGKTFADRDYMTWHAIKHCANKDKPKDPTAANGSTPCKQCNFVR